MTGKFGCHKNSLGTMSCWFERLVQGKEGYPTIGLEAVSDYNLCIWYSIFSYVGSLNDINIWDQSPLYESMLKGTHGKIDFPLEINGEHFSQLYYLVDCINLLLSRSLATINNPTTSLDCFFAPRQEGFQKSMWRVYGVSKQSSFLLD